MQQQQSSFTNRAGLQIHQQSWAPDGDIKAWLLVVHGMAEHSGRYQPLAEYLGESGYALCTLDLPGHGKSEGDPGHIDSFADFLDTLDQTLEQLKALQPDKPIFLLGHSMGGLISASFLLDHQQDFRGAILSGAAIQAPGGKPPWIQVFIVRLLSRFAPAVGVMQLDANGVSRDPEVVAEYRADPLNYPGKISARGVFELFSAMDTIQTRASEITLPLLVMHGEADSMTPVEGSRLFHQRAGSADKTLRTYPGLYHEIFNEPERMEIFAELRDWLNLHC
jgi:alpha-beta hydrolase superfamily lysophospholipase